MTSTNDKLLVEIKRQMDEALIQMQRMFDLEMYFPKYIRLEEMAQQAAHTIFGDIINPTPDPLQGLKNIMNGKQPDWNGNNDTR